MGFYTLERCLTFVLASVVDNRFVMLLSEIASDFYLLIHFAGMSLFSSFFVLLLILVQSSPPTSHSISLLGK